MDSTASERVLATIPRDRLLRAGDAGYDEARQVWNGMISHRPAVIARVESEDDVVAALAIARDEGLPVSIRGGGHNVAGLAVGDGALVIDLSAMNGVTVDPAARRAGRRAAPRGATRRGGAGPRPRDAGRRRLRDRRGRPDAERRPRLAAPQARPELRRAARRDGGHRGRPDRARERRRAPGPVLGAPRRRRQLRRRHRVRVRALSASARRSRRPSRSGRSTRPQPCSPSSATWPRACPTRSRRSPCSRRSPTTRRSPTASAAATGCSSWPSPRPPLDEGAELLRPIAALGGGATIDIGGQAQYAEFQQFFDAEYPAHTMRYYWKSSFADDLPAGIIERPGRDLRSAPVAPFDDRHLGQPRRDRARIGRRQRLRPADRPRG